MNKMEKYEISKKIILDNIRELLSTLFINNTSTKGYIMTTPLSEIIDSYNTTGGTSLTTAGTDDARVILDIEKRAKVLQGQMDVLRHRWENRVSKLQKRRYGCYGGITIRRDYDFEDALA